MSTTRCVGAVMLSETRDVLHLGQIPETPGKGKYWDCLNVDPDVQSRIFLTWSATPVHEPRTACLEFS
jgi:hypothetical protein